MVNKNTNMLECGCKEISKGLESGLDGIDPQVLSRLDMCSYHKKMDKKRKEIYDRHEKEAENEFQTFIADLNSRAFKKYKL